MGKGVLTKKTSIPLRKSTNGANLDNKVKIQNGCDLLDHELGEGWVLLIDTSTFNIADGSYCVLGQVFDPKSLQVPQWQAFYAGGTSALHSLNGYAQEWAYEYGFDFDMGFAGDVPNEMWIAEIERRQVKLVGSVEKAREILENWRKKRRVRRG